MEDLLTNTGDTLKELKTLIDSGDEIGIAAYVEEISPAELARTVTRLDDGDRTRFLELLGPARAAFVLSKLSSIGAASIVEQIDLDQAAPIVGEMTSRDQANLLRDIGGHRAERILQDVESTTGLPLDSARTFQKNRKGRLENTSNRSWPVRTGWSSW